MPKMQDLIYSKYGQSWYKHKIIKKLWKNMYFKPIFLLKIIIAEIETNFNIITDPEFNWLFKAATDRGRSDLVISYLECEYEIRSAINKT